MAEPAEILNSLQFSHVPLPPLFFITIIDDCGSVVHASSVCVCLRVCCCVTEIKRQIKETKEKRERKGLVYLCSPFACRRNETY